MGKGFFKENAQFVESVLQLLDLLFILLAFLTANYLKFGSLEMTDGRLLLIVSTMLCVHTVFSYSGQYRRWRGKTIGAEVISLGFAFGGVLLILGIFFFLSKTGQQYSRVWVVLSFGIAFVFTASSRLLIRSIAKWRRRNGFNTRSVLIVGGGELGIRVSRSLAGNSWTGIQVVGFIDDDENLADKWVEGFPVLGKTDETLAVVERFRRRGAPIDYVWIALPAEGKAVAERTIDALLDSTVSVSLVPDYFDVQLMKSKVDIVADIPLVNFSNNNIRGISGLAKQAFDFFLASIIVLVISPLLAIISIVIKLDSSGPVVFVQRRYGIDGKEIAVWKFRTMKVMDDGDSVTQAVKGDARVTSIGAFLRKTSLDELPQFFNVLQGRMSIVGPRPHAVAHNEFYRKRIKGYMTRHVIRPGITGLAQVSGYRGETETDEKMSKRVECDLRYINRWSFGLDLKIIVMTLREVLLPKNVY